MYKKLDNIYIVVPIRKFHYRICFQGKYSMGFDSSRESANLYNVSVNLYRIY